MTQRLIKVRVRPSRPAVLISRHATTVELLLAFAFFSKIWGGRYCQILVVDPASPDGLTEFRLGCSRPDLVYGIGLNDDVWAKAVHQACQPRSYGRLQSDFVNGIKQPHREDYWLVDRALVHLFRTRDQRKGRKRSLRVVRPKSRSSLEPYCAAVFGTPHPDLHQDYFDEEVSLAGEDPAEFIELATVFVKEWHQSWLDVTGHELSLWSHWGHMSPTVVLVGDLISDLSLFWNLRTNSDHEIPAWIIPLPVSSAGSPEIVDKLKNWLLAFLRYGSRPDYCNVTSLSVSKASCEEFAVAFQESLDGTPIEIVSYESPRNRLRDVLPYEYDTAWPVDIRGRRLTMQPPRPKAFEDFGRLRDWHVDLVKDLKTRRAPKELQLPPGVVAFELLNGPCPPSFHHSQIPRTGDGPDSINIRCSASDEVIHVHLPSGKEVLEETLWEHGIEPLKDEKCSLYFPIIRRFGGLYRAAEAFRGTSGRVLQTLAGGTKTVNEILGACRLGDGTLPEKGYLDRIDEFMFGRASERIRRVGRKRFADYVRHQAPENLRLNSLLEYWADRGIIVREWEVGPCTKCNRRSFVPGINLRRRVTCPACGNRISLSQQVLLGYSLQKHLKLAIDEGIVPVVLTGRFLERMTDHGFFWIPGVKYKHGEAHGDLDIVACCDGHLVFCECKQMTSTPGDAAVWDEVLRQFFETVKIAKTCRASLVVLAARVADYPQAVQERIASEIAASIPYLLLTSKDLEPGHGNSENGNAERNLTLGDLIPTPFPEAQRAPTDRPRTIVTDWGTHTE